MSVNYLYIFHSKLKIQYDVIISFYLNPLKVTSVKT